MNAHTSNNQASNTSANSPRAGGKRGTAHKSTDATPTLADRGARAIEDNPLAVLVGGLVLGVLAGSVLPKTEQEAKLLGPVGRRLNDTAKGAFDAARDAGKSELDLVGISRNAARDQAGKMIEGVLKALASAGAAALTAKKEAAAAAE